MAGGLVSVTERSEHGGPCLDTGNEESVAHIQPSVGIVLGESSVQQPGTLYVTGLFPTFACIFFLSLLTCCRFLTLLQ
jgi:hypothetical protein